MSEEYFKDGNNLTDYSISFYNLDWNFMDIKYGKHKRNRNVGRPKHLHEMIEIARKFSIDFPFVRVDFFDTGEKLYMAELTFYPGEGMTPYYPESFNKEMGDWLRLP